MLDDADLILNKDAYMKTVQHILMKKDTYTNTFYHKCLNASAKQRNVDIMKHMCLQP